MHSTILVLAALLAAEEPASDGREVLLFDFEAGYAGWEASGDAFGSEPARGTLPGQQHVSGYFGKALVNSFLKGDGPRGKLTSPVFELSRSHLSFLIGGGAHASATCMNLLVEGKVVRTATGSASTGSDDEHLSWVSWDVGELAGKSARLEIVDNSSASWGHVLVDHIVLGDRPRAPSHLHPAVARAMSSVLGAAGRASADPSRPVCHFRPPALWMNDPNGPIQVGEWYHLFYQENPYGDRWEHMHWGHARTRDLVHWEHLPIALWPSKELGEDHCFSGSAARDGKGRIVLLYTSIGKRLPEQWAATSDDPDLILWKKHPGNPIMTEALHGGVKVHEWRDPFVFEHEGRRFAVLGGNLNASAGGGAVVTLYRAEDDELTRWSYVGILYKHPNPKVVNIECPNFFQLGDKWVLIVSPHGIVEYKVGSLDTTTWKFTPEREGIMDRSSAYYAPNCFADSSGRRILWSWVRDFPNGRGWNGCMTFPRVLTVDGEGFLRQEPAAELAALRAERLVSVKEKRLEETSMILPEVAGSTLEVILNLEPGTAAACGLRVRRSADGSRAVAIEWKNGNLTVAGASAPLPLRDGALRLHVFLDRSVLEVYAGGRECFTRVIQSEPGDLGVEVFATGGAATIRSLEAWRLMPVW